MGMDGDLPDVTEVEEDVPICHQLDLDMIVPATAEMGEVRYEDNIVLRESLHHPRSSTQTSVTPTTSGSRSSCTTPLPSTTLPPTTFTMSPGSPSSPLEPSPTDTQPPFGGCSSTDGGENYDELPLPTTRGTFTACSNSGETTNTAAVLTSRSASPTTAVSIGNQQSDTISRSQEGATSELLTSPGLFLIRLILLLITSSFPLNPGRPV